MSAAFRPASFSAILQGSIVRLHELLDEGLELGAGDLDVQVLRPGGVGRDVGQVDVGLLGARELDLGLLGRLLQTLQGQGILVHVDARLLLELVGEVVDQAVVEVLATEEGVAVGREHLELVLAVDLGDLDDRDVEGAAAEVVDRDGLVAALLVHAVGEGGGGRLVDDALDVETGDAAGVLGRLALRVVEVGGHGDHRLLDALPEVFLGGLLHLHQDARGDLGRGHLLAARLDPGVAVVGLDDLVGDDLDVLLDGVLVEAAADQALDRVQRVLGVGDRLALGRLADDDLAVLLEGDDGGRRAIALGVLDDPGLAPFHDRDTRVRRAEVDTDDGAHVFSPVDRVEERDPRGGIPWLRGKGRGRGTVSKGNGPIPSRRDGSPDARGRPGPYFETITSAGRISRSLSV